MSRQLRALALRPFKATAQPGRLGRWIGLPLVLSAVMAGRAWGAVAEVKDTAHFFSSDAIAKATKVLAEIQKKYHQDVLIETLPTLPADKAEAFSKMSDRQKAVFWKSLAEEHYKAAKLQGIYALICKSPGHVHIVVGEETAKRDFHSNDRIHLTDLLISAFEAKDFDRGLIDAVEFVDNRIGENVSEASRPAEALPQGIQKGVDIIGPTVQKIGPAVQGASGMGWLLILIIVVVGFWILRAIFRGIFHMLGGGGPRRYPPGPGGGGYAGPGYGGGPGYGAPGYGGGGGGGFMSGMLGGLFGAAAGNWLYDSFGRGGGGLGGGGYAGRSFGGSSDSGPAPSDADQDYSGTGGDFGDNSGGDSGGGDFGSDDTGGGGDFGGDSGGAGYDSGGGDFGGGGGDFGGDSGGGDFGGGGGDF